MNVANENKYYGHSVHTIARHREKDEMFVVYQKVVKIKLFYQYSKCGHNYSFILKNVIPFTHSTASVSDNQM